MLPLSLLISLFGCEEILSYPDEPSIDYKSFDLFLTSDALGNEFFLGKMQFGFTDGDGDIGLKQPTSDDLADTLKYNLFMSMFEIKNGQVVKVGGPAGETAYRIPFIERNGQNKTLKGDIIIDIEYKILNFDSIFYTFYIMDRAFNRSNSDTTHLVVFTGLSL